MENPDHLGLTKRELEKEMAWLLKRLPEDPQQLLKLVWQSVVILIDKNNAAIAKALERREEGAAASTAPHQETKA